jgi:transposase-like protein
MMQDVTAAALERISSSEKKATALQLSEESLECPYCYETILKIYDWDKPRYLCENCDSIFSTTFCEDELNII